MPTNLPPDYFNIEKKHRAAKTVAEKIATLEELIRVVPKHKGTEKLRGDLRRRLSKLKQSPQTRKGGSRQESVYQIERGGAGRVVVVGPTNVGKSALVAALTNATPEVAEHPFTTWAPTPGMMEVGKAQIQLIDTPPLDRDYIEPELAELIRMADLVLVMLDLQAYPLAQYDSTLEILRSLLVVPSEPAPEEGQLLPKPMIFVVNKVDDQALDEEFAVLCELLPQACPFLPLSVSSGRHFDVLKQTVFEALGVIRVFAKPPGEEADLSAPFVLAAGSTVEDLAGMVHKDFLEKLKVARVWGSGVFDGQQVGRQHVLQDGDIVELRL